MLARNQLSATALFFHLSGTVTLFAAPQKPDERKTKQILAEFEDYAQRAMQEWQIPGMAVAIVADDMIIFAKGFGVKEVNGNDPVDTHTFFQIGSASKAFTAALVAMMVDEGKMAWKDKVIDHVPGFRMNDAWVTREFMIEDLLAQHSGMPPYAADFQAIAGFDRDHIMYSIRYIKPVSSFRSEFAYVNNLFLVAARTVENETGKIWEVNIRERIFDPLGMDESSMGRDSLVNSKKAATGHNIQKGKVTPVPKTLNWPYIYGPAGGINSNVLDMAEWLRLQINDGMVDGNRLVSEENMNFIHTPKTITSLGKGDRMYYCESWVYEEMRPYPLVWHNGGTTGFHAFVGFWTEPKIGIVILTNESTNKLAEALPHYFNDLYFGNPAVRRYECYIQRHVRILHPEGHPFGVTKHENHPLVLAKLFSSGEPAGASRLVGGNLHAHDGAANRDRIESRRRRDGTWLVAAGGQNHDSEDLKA